MHLNYQSLTSWSVFYLRMCEFIAQKSKDPSTKVGAVIVRPDMTLASIGYNGFPRGVRDQADRYASREKKYPRIVHAELNAILNAREPLKGYLLYVSPISPCNHCAGAIIQSGISHVFAVMKDSAMPTWSEQAKLSEEMFEEAGVHSYTLTETDLFHAEGQHRVSQLALVNG